MKTPQPGQHFVGCMGTLPFPGRIFVGFGQGRVGVDGAQTLVQPQPVFHGQHKLRQQIELLLQIREHDKAKVESDSIVASCDCNVKTNDPQLHAKGCKYRLICERDTAREKIDAISKRAEAIRCLLVILGKEPRRLGHRLPSHQMKMNYFIESHLTGQTGENREWRTFKTGSLAELQAWLDQRKERPYGPKQPYRLVDKDGKVIDATA